MKGSEAQLLGFMEGANNRYIIPVYQRKYNGSGDAFLRASYARHQIAQLYP